MIGPTTLKEIRAQLCQRLGVSDEELDVWMRRTIPKPHSSLEPNDGELQSLLQQLEDAATKEEKKPNGPRRKSPRSGLSHRQRTPKAS
jgi:hypothetical protein